MRDIDAVMAYESKQQELIEGVIRNLGHHIDENYLSILAKLLVMGVTALGEQDCLDGLRLRGDVAMYDILVKPIKEFSDKEVERKYLLSRVMEKLAALVFGQYSAVYLSHSLASA